VSINSGTALAFVLQDPHQRLDRFGRLGA